MKSYIYDFRNIIVYVIICIEIFYIIYNYNNLIIKNITFKYFILSFQWFKLAIALFVIGLLFEYGLIIYFLNIQFIPAFIMLFLTFIICTEYKLKKNKSLSNKTQLLKDASNDFKTGDIVIFETAYNMGDIYELIPVHFLGISHIGLILKEKDEIYLMHADIHENYCEFSKQTKTGVVLQKLSDVISNMNYSFFVAKTNFHLHVNNDDINKFFEKYRHNIYMENNINCISFIVLFLKEFNFINSYNDILPTYIEYEKILDNSFYNFNCIHDILKIKI